MLKSGLAYRTPNRNKMSEPLGIPKDLCFLISYIFLYGDGMIWISLAVSC